MDSSIQVRCSLRSRDEWRLTSIGTDTLSGKEVALKLRHIRDDPRTLEDEAETYKTLAGATGIPQVLWFGQECEYNVLVHELLGPSLEDLFNYCDRKFSLKTVLLVADQAISRIESIHARGFLHRDIKPDNFVMGVGRQGNTLYTIDFGLAKEFSLAESDRKYEGRGFGGTSRYASINNHSRHGVCCIKYGGCFITNSRKSSLSEMTWSHLGTCSCTFCVAPCRGKV